MPWTTDWQIDGALFWIESSWKRVFSFLCRVVFVPRISIDKVMQQLARTRRPISMPRKVLWNQLSIRQFRSHLLPVVIEARPISRNAAHDCSSRWITSRCRTMSVREQDALASQSIDVGSLCLRMATETTNPVVEIVHRDKQDIGFGKLIPNAWTWCGQQAANNNQRL